MRGGALLRDGALWGGASALVLALHLGGALWLLHRPGAAAPAGLPAPVFVDLAPAEAAPAPAAEPPPVDAPPESLPDPAEVAPPLTLPPLPRLEPVADMTDLFPPAPALDRPPEDMLNRSARPQPRPERRPAPTRQADPPAPQPPRQAEAPRPDLATLQPSAPPAAARAPQGAQGPGAAGPSPQRTASLMAQWGGQIRSCISRRAAVPPGLRKGGRVILNLSVARSGTIQGVGVAGSSGNAALDQAALRAAQRAGRCPRAPAGLTEASYGFQLPISLQVR